MLSAVNCRKELDPELFWVDKESVPFAASRRSSRNKRQNNISDWRFGAWGQPVEFHRWDEPHSDYFNRFGID